VYDQGTLFKYTQSPLTIYELRFRWKY